MSQLRTSLTIAAASALAFVGLVPSPAPAAQPQLAVFRFTGKGFAKGFLDSATSIAETAARRVSAGRFKILTRGMLAEVVGEEKLLQCEAQARCELDLGVGLGTGYMLTGSFRKVGARVDLTTRLYGVQKLELLAQERDSAGHVEELLDEVEPIVERLMRGALGSGGPAAPAGAAEGRASEAAGVSLPSSRSEECVAEMAWFPGWTGTDDGGKTWVIRPFLLDVKEVTVEAYAACVNAGKCTAAWSTVSSSPLSLGGADLKEHSARCNEAKPGRMHHPANCVDWRQAAAYCGAVGKRLPTEMEWEWAARGAERGTVFPWGDLRSGVTGCWNGNRGEDEDDCVESGSGTCAVGSFASSDSPQGVKDLFGNVAEWTSTTRTDSHSATLYVIRGAHWCSASLPGQVDAMAFSPTLRHSTVGFRCARSP
jgi:hypothetical protein